MWVYAVVFLVICVIWFIITRLWIGAVDGVFSLLKKIFKRKDSNRDKNWHTIDEIKDKNKK